MATGSGHLPALANNISDQNNNNNNNIIQNNEEEKVAASGRLMSNLPYMGELNFDTRPRRGRKPKKADICHLISKNYGITFPLSYVNTPNSALDTPMSPFVDTAPSFNNDEPLNLCLRDSVQSSSHGNLVKNTHNTNYSTIQQSDTDSRQRRRKRIKKVAEKIILPQPPPPPSEVSICKFKFTGGLRPSLQEKKMLSVDSGGNFRFYSDKQPNKTTISSPLSISSHSPQQGQSHPSPHHPHTLPPLPLSPDSDVSSSTDDEDGLDEGKRKRRTRKSLMREKLEKTFKEKGFLIQTQQLESAEGATYCKFRQLRKFTRYLFRSWKDYLPENVKGESPCVTSGPSVPPPHMSSTTSTSSPLLPQREDGDISS